MLAAAPDGTNRKNLCMTTTATDLPVNPPHPNEHRPGSARGAAGLTPWAAVVFAAFTIGAEKAEKQVPADHAVKMAASQQLFARTVRPWLEKNCLECHGGAKIKSDFNLSTRESLLKGGDKGVAVLPGQGANSPLVKYIRHEEMPHMPPKKPAAPAEIVAAVTRWIDLGAAYDKPLGSVTAAKKPLTVTGEGQGILGLSTAATSAAAGREGCVLAAHAHRSLPAGEDGDARRSAGGGGGSPHPGAPAVLRPDRPAAQAGGSRVRGGRSRL